MTGDGRGRCQLRLMALIFGWMVALTMVPPVRAQTVDPLSIDVSNCPTPAATPACATLAYSQCLWLNKPSLCAAVGAGDLVIWEGPLETVADLAAVPRHYIGRLGRRFPVIRKMVEGPNMPGRIDANGVPVLGADKYHCPTPPFLRPGRYGLRSDPLPAFAGAQDRCPGSGRAASPNTSRKGTADLH